MSITFGNTAKSTKTVNKLLAKILPGQSTDQSDSSSSNSQRLTSSYTQHNKVDPYKVQKTEKKQKRNAIKISTDQRAKLLNEARAKILEDHISQGNLTQEEKLQLKLKVKKNVAGVQSWALEDDGELKEIQDNILNLQKSNAKRSQRGDSKKKAKGKKGKKIGEEIYKKETLKKYPGLTPGLAPVDMDDDSEEED